MKIIENTDKEFTNDLKSRIKENGGYCLCSLERTPEFKCMCLEFRQQVKNNIPGSCSCGLYIATK